jgi:hypothetical protein
MAKFALPDDGNGAGVGPVTPGVLGGVLVGPHGRGVRVPAVPEWAVMLSLPAVRLRGGGTLSRDAVERLCALLMLSKVGAPHPAIAEVRVLCEPADLAAFGWGLVEQWQAAESPTRSSGLAMQALAALGDDSVVPRFAALFPFWAKGSGTRVRTGVTVLAAIGSDLALTQLHRLTRTGRTDGVRRMARECLAGVAEARGLSAAQLADRIVPDLGLDPQGRITFDYGPRRFVIELDEHLTPRIADGAGKRLTRMPKPSASDDPVLAPAAYERFAELKKELKDVAVERIRAMEEAMVDGRRWTVEEFRELLVVHPLMGQVTRRLLWGTFDGEDLVTAFRVAEDRTFADVDDKARTLDADAAIGPVHPWHLGDTCAQWSTVFDDYEIIQPFAQLGREVYELPDGAADVAELISYAGIRVHSGRAYGLASRGWDLTDAHRVLLREWPGGRTVEIRLRHGYHPWERDGTNALHHVRVQVARSTTPARFGDLHPIAFSETIRDVESLRG